MPPRSKGKKSARQKKYGTRGRQRTAEHSIRLQNIEFCFFIPQQCYQNEQVLFLAPVQRLLEALKYCMCVHSTICVRGKEQVWAGRPAHWAPFSRALGAEHTVYVNELLISGGILFYSPFTHLFSSVVKGLKKFNTCKWAKHNTYDNVLYVMFRTKLWT